MESLRASKVKDFESQPIVVSSTSPISAVISVLEQNDAYEAFVQEENKISTITVREILKASDISNMKVSSLMFYVSKLRPDDAVGKAARIMSDYRLRALPIVREETIEGAVTAKSLCQPLMALKEFRNIRVNQIMKRSLITIRGEESVSKARNLMLKSSIDHLPVLDSGGLRGILLSNHIVLSMLPKEGLKKGAFVSEPASPSDLKVSGLMDPDPLTCEPEEKVLEVLRKITAQGKTYAVVKLWHEIQGIVTYRDFMDLLAEEEGPDIPAYIVGLPDDPFEAELAKAKFLREAKTLRRAFPTIEEIRSTIKTKYISEDRRRYEVSVLIKSAGNTRVYSETGWDLAEIFDEITDRTKRLLAQKPSRRRKSQRIISP